MYEKDRISVIVPVYKVEPYLDRCLQSIVGQTYQSLEILLVDDGSPDNCPAMCDAWAERDSRIKVIHKSNGGLSDARNAGMAAASGEYVSFIDSDDWIEPEMMERLLKAMIKDQSDIAACTVKIVWEDNTPPQLMTVQENCVLEREEAQRALLKETLLKQPVWYKLYKTDLVKKIPFDVGKYHEDVFWSYQAVGAATRVSVIDYPGYNYHQRSGSIMGEGYSLKRLDAVEASERRYEYLKREFPSMEREAKLAVVSKCIYHGQMAMKYLSEPEQAQAFASLCAVAERHRLQYRDYAGIKASHRVWYFLSGISLRGTCALKNLFGVGL